MDCLLGVWLRGNPLTLKCGQTSWAPHFYVGIFSTKSGSLSRTMFKIVNIKMCSFSSKTFIVILQTIILLTQTKLCRFFLLVCISLCISNNNNNFNYFYYYYYFTFQTFLAMLFSLIEQLDSPKGSLAILCTLCG